MANDATPTPDAMPRKRRVVELVYFNAGGGHKASALALQAAIRSAGLGWDVRLVNLFESVDTQAVFRRWTGMAPETYYNKRLELGWTLGLTQELKLLQAGIRLAHDFLKRRLVRHWQQSRPDLVVSMVPNFNRELYESVTEACPGVPYVTILTDLADLPPHFWIEPGQDQHLVCGTPHAVEQALAQGYSPEHIHATSGMILREEFYRPRMGEAERAKARQALGLDPVRPTAVVLFGGSGSRSMIDIARRLPNLQLILMCGHNSQLAAHLATQESSATHVVVGFTKEIPRYMQLADFFIGKPGPGSVSEAVHMGLPVIVTSNAWTMPQERYNAQWIEELRVGVVIGNFRRIAEAAALVETRLDAFRANVARVHNRAAFEVPPLLDGILRGVMAPAAAAG